MSNLQPLQQLQYVPRPMPSHDIGDQGELAWLPLSKLRVDPDYQRAILDSGKANIRRMIEGFSWLLFGTVVVARRAGDTYAIIDGQHRATAALLHGGVTKVPCLILKGGQAAEARAFSAINGNVTRIHTLQSFRAKVTAGDADACALVKFVAAAGVTIAGYPKTELNPGETLALGALRTGIKREGEKYLLGALRLLRALDPDAGLGAAAIMGTTYALKQHPDWLPDVEKTGTKISAKGKLAQLGEKARARKVSHGGAEWANFSAVMASTLAQADRFVDEAMKRKMMAGR